MNNKVKLIITFIVLAVVVWLWIAGEKHYERICWGEKHEYPITKANPTSVCFALVGYKLSIGDAPNMWQVNMEVSQNVNL